MYHFCSLNLVNIYISGSTRFIRFLFEGCLSTSHIHIFGANLVSLEVFIYIFSIVFFLIFFKSFSISSTDVNGPGRQLVLVVVAELLCLLVGHQAWCISLVLILDMLRICMHTKLHLYTVKDAIISKGFNTSTNILSMLKEGFGYFNVGNYGIFGTAISIFFSLPSRFSPTARATSKQGFNIYNHSVVAVIGYINVVQYMNAR